VSAGNCDRCDGDGVHPSKYDPTWKLICFPCKGTGNFPPTTNPVLAWWHRITERIDDALDRLGVL
jgi:hypothetical protein